MDIKTLVMDFVACRGEMQAWINNRYKDSKSSVIQFRHFNYIVTKDDVKFYTTPDLETIDQVYNDYWFDDLKSDDVVVDIGANIGGFSLVAAKKARMVYSYEPIRHHELFDNVLLNGNQNVKVSPFGLGDGQPTLIEWEGIKKTVETFRFEQVPEHTFLKIDSEGAEWHIPPEQLAQPRRIEAELHWWGHGKKYWPGWKQVLDEYYEYDLTKVSNANVIGILHAVRK
jgi:FkbM family methyltransferase